MGQKSAERQGQPTIGDIPDDVWPLIHTMLDADYAAKPTGPRRVALRCVLKGIIFRVRTGCPWTQLPTPCGDDRTVHRHVQRWCQRGLLARLWAVLVASGEAWGGVDWPGPAADTALGHARMGGDLVGRTPTARGTQGCNAAAW